MNKKEILPPNTTQTVICGMVLTNALPMKPIDVSTPPNIAINRRSILVLSLIAPTIGPRNTNRGVSHKALISVIAATY